MHKELSVSKETDQKHATWTALNVIKKKIFPKEKVMRMYEVTDDDIFRYEKEWAEMNSARE